MILRDWSPIDRGDISASPRLRELVGEILKRQLWARLVVLLSIAGVGVVRRRLGTKGLLHFAQVKPNQSVGEQYCRDAAGTPKPVNSRLADLQHIGELTRGQILRSPIFGLFRRVGFSWFRGWFLSLSCHLFLHRFE
jgi:hypothetical protein